MSEDYKDKYRQLLGEFDEMESQSRNALNQLYEQLTGILGNFRDTDKELGDAIRLLPVRLDDYHIPDKKLAYINELLVVSLDSSHTSTAESRAGDSVSPDQLETALQLLSSLLQQLPAELNPHLDRQNLQQQIAWFAVLEL